MRNFYLQEFRMRWSQLPKQGELRGIKRILIWGFLAGLFIFFLYGEEFFPDADLLNQAALKEIRDSSMDKKHFFEYVFAKRMLLFSVGVLAWWWGFGKVYLYTVLSICSFTMGGLDEFIQISFYGNLFMFFFIFSTYDFLLCSHDMWYNVKVKYK